MTVELLREFRVFYRRPGLHLPRPEPPLLLQLEVAADGEEGGLVLGEHLVVGPGHAPMVSLKVREMLPELRQLVLQPMELLTDSSVKQITILNL